MSPFGAFAVAGNFIVAVFFVSYLSFSFSQPSEPTAMKNQKAMDSFDDFADIFSGTPPSKPSESRITLDFNTIMESSMGLDLLHSSSSTSTDDKKAMAFTDIMQSSLLTAKESPPQPNLTQAMQFESSLNSNSEGEKKVENNSEIGKNGDPFADFGSFMSSTMLGNQSVLNSKKQQEDPFHKVEEDLFEQGNIFENPSEASIVSATVGFESDPFGNEDPFSSLMAPSGFEEISTAATNFGGLVNQSINIGSSMEITKPPFSRGSTDSPAAGLGLTDLTMIEMDASLSSPQEQNSLLDEFSSVGLSGLNLGIDQNTGNATSPSADLGGLDNGMIAETPKTHAAEQSSSNTAIYQNIDIMDIKSSTDQDEIYQNIGSINIEGSIGLGNVTKGLDDFGLDFGIINLDKESGITSGPDNLSFGRSDDKSGTNSASEDLFGDLGNFGLNATNLSLSASISASHSPLVTSSNESKSVRMKNIF